MGVLRRMAEYLDLVERTDSEFTAAFQDQVETFWSELQGAGAYASPYLIERVWVVNRCIQLNSNAVSTMPLRYYGGREPTWVSNPDPNWYPNGISEAIFSAIWSYYSWGDAYLYVTSRYADGYPSNWTVLDPAAMSVESVGGKRRYRIRQQEINADNVIQVSRDPRGNLTGTSVIKSYSSYAYGLLAASDLGRVMMAEGATPNAVLKSNRKLTAAQAEAIQLQWVSRTAVRRGAPAVLPPDIDFEQLSFSPSDLLLLDAQKFDAQVLASSCGIPAQILNLSLEGGLTYQTPIHALEQWWRTELKPTAHHIAAALSAQCLPRGQYVEFDEREFLAPGYKDFAEVVVSLVEKGILTIEEARATLLNIRPDAGTETVVDAFLTPGSAGASPALNPSSVVQLRPTQAVSSV
jgi:HK97 family phage portal protein